jgi:VanZ family protein
MKLLHFLPALLWWAVVTYCSVNAVPSLPDFNLFEADKLIHFGIYALLSLFLIGGSVRSGYALDARLLTQIVLFSAGWGALMECVQAYLPFRFFEWDDMIANAAGAACALPMFFWVLRRW